MRPFESVDGSVELAARGHVRRCRADDHRGEANLNADVVLTRLVNPWTAPYVGYNSNAREMPAAVDVWQLFTKWSYLFQR